MRWLHGSGVIALIAALGAIPVFSQTANFGNLTLAPGFAQGAGSASGYTGGSYSLSSIANRDRNNNHCIGFGAPTPDHILVLESNFSNLSVLVNTGGKDTTLVIQGPNNQTLRCGDDSGSSKDASVRDTNWSAGTYKVWVGTFEPGQRLNYTLTVRE